MLKPIAHRFIFPCILFTSLSGATLAGKFPSSKFDLPDGWDGPAFQLSQEYPNNPPKSTDLPWKKIDFKKEPETYLRAALAYCLEGNVETDFRGYDNPVRTWFHVPWQHHHLNGREPISGFTRERDIPAGELHENQKRTVQNWGIGLYNPIGAYTIGQVWDDPENPQPEKGTFSEGTVSFKFIFTEASLEEVPYLKGSLERQAYIHHELDDPYERELKTLRLLQVDIMVKDDRAKDTTGWLAGALLYRGDRPGENWWDRLETIGLMWGNDPGVTEEQSKEDPTLIKESWIAPHALNFIARVGHGGRLAGPADSPQSSCLSCHATAQTTPISSMVAPHTIPPELRTRWFDNLPGGQPFDRGQTGLDYSLQLSEGLRHFYSQIKVTPEKVEPSRRTTPPLEKTPSS